MKAIAVTIAVFLMVSILVEALVEYYKSIDKMITRGEYKTAITQVVTIVLSIGFGFIFNLQLFNNVLSEVYGCHINSTIDIILTGILISRGSNYFSDLVRRLTNIDVFNPDDIQIMVGDGSEMDEFLEGGE